MNEFMLLTGEMLEVYLADTKQPDGDWGSLDEKWLRLSLRTGDAIALAGAAVTLGERYGEIIFPCLARDETNVRSLFACTPTVKVVRLKELGQVFNQNGLTTPGVGLTIAVESVLPRFSKAEYYEHIYTSCGIPYEYRWSRCPLSVAAECVEQVRTDCKEYVFYHDDPLRGYRINVTHIPPDHFHYPIICPEYEAGRSILAYKDLLRRAKHRHVIDSAFWWMLEHLGIGGHYHRYAKQPRTAGWTDFKARSDWTIID